MPDGTGAGPMPSEQIQARDRRLATVAAAIRSTTEVRRLAREWAAAGVPVMVLRGPPVQLRLLGSDSAYRSADVDLLVPAAHRRRVFRLLRSSGWRFAPENGVLWRLDGAAAFTRGTTTVDLHWGLHAHSVSARHLRPLERALWSEPTLAADGWYEPRLEPLLVYLAVHGAASGFHKPESLTLVQAASRLVTDWAAVRRVAEEAHVWSTVRHARAVADGDTTGAPPPIFDGRLRQLLSRGSRRIRSLSAVPVVRRAVRAVRSRRDAPPTPPAGGVGDPAV